jgi:uncharacterized membrane protein YraQ (UPF0718 family)
MDMIRKSAERIGTGGIFLLVVLAIYLVLGLTRPDLAGKAFSVMRRLMLHLVPVLILVFGIMFVTNLFCEARGIVTLLGVGSGVRGWILAISGGIVSSGPIYMWYPLLSDLKERGMKDSLIAAFLYNRAIKIPLLPMMVYYFGWSFTAVLSMYMVLFSIINGILVQRCIGGERKR